MTSDLINVLQAIINSLPDSKRKAPQTELDKLKLVVPKSRWSPEQRAKQSKSIADYWARRHLEQPFQLKYRNGQVIDLKGWEAAAKCAGLKESTLKIKLSKSGGLRAQFFDQESSEVVDLIKLPYK